MAAPAKLTSPVATGGPHGGNPRDSLSPATRYPSNREHVPAVRPGHVHDKRETACNTPAELAGPATVSPNNGPPPEADGLTTLDVEREQRAATVAATARETQQTDVLVLVDTEIIGPTGPVGVVNVDLAQQLGQSTWTQLHAAERGQHTPATRPDPATADTIGCVVDGEAPLIAAHIRSHVGGVAINVEEAKLWMGHFGRYHDLDEAKRSLRNGEATDLFSTSTATILREWMNGLQLAWRTLARRPPPIPPGGRPAKTDDLRETTGGTPNNEPTRPETPKGSLADTPPTDPTINMCTYFATSNPD